MWHRFDPSLRTAIVRALGAAGRESRAEADAGHVLLGILDERAMPAALQRHADALSANLRTNNPQTSPTLPPANALASDARELLDRAYDHAAQLGHRHIGAEHVLLALTTHDFPP